MELIELLARCFASIIILFLITKIMGYRQISQLSFYDYIIGISIGSISADMATGLDVDWWNTALPLVIYGGFSLLLSYITTKSIKARHFLTGVPVVLVEGGEILKENLKKVHFDINDFLAECRSNGYFNVNDIQYAVMEHTGKISFLLDPLKRPCCPEDLNLNPQPEGLVVNLILDGTVMHNHLKKIGKEEKWLNKQLDEKNIASVSDVMLATYDVNGNFEVFEQNHKKDSFNVFD